MTKQNVNVKSYKRTRFGKKENVSGYTKSIKKVELTQVEKERIKTGKSKKIGSPIISNYFIESLAHNKKIKISKEDSGWTVYYKFSTDSLGKAKSSVKFYRSEGYGAYYYRGSLNKTPIYRVYKSSSMEKKKIKKKSENDFEKLKELQIKEEDWSHLSLKYPNLMGLTDEQVDTFIQKRVDIGHDREKVESYVSSIRAYNKDDIMDISVDMELKFSENASSKWHDYDKSSTVYVTSPRGGPEVLSNYAYANRLSKSNMPYDFYIDPQHGEYKRLMARSLPYGSKILTVSDIVFVDDICMSGEQQDKAYVELKYAVSELDIAKEHKPRLHYMAIVGNEAVLQDDASGVGVYGSYHQPWDSVTIGEVHKFSSNYKGEYPGISAAVFPYSIPDGDRHEEARKLYRSVNQYRHM